MLLCDSQMFERACELLRFDAHHFASIIGKQYFPTDLEFDADDTLVMYKKASPPYCFAVATSSLPTR